MLLAMRAQGFRLLLLPLVSALLVLNALLKLLRATMSSVFMASSSLATVS